MFGSIIAGLWGGGWLGTVARGYPEKARSNVVSIEAPN